jgi:hypothetical protein
MMIQTGYERYRHPGLPPAMPPPLKMVHEYTEGTLILDVLDAATKSLVWRGNGAGGGAAVGRCPDPRGVYPRILERFPPKA